MRATASKLPVCMSVELRLHRIHSVQRYTGPAAGRPTRSHPAGWADVKAEPSFARPACCYDGQQGFFSVDDLGSVQGATVTAGAMSKIGFVNHVDRSAGLVGNVGGRSIAYVKPVLLVGICRNRPNRGIESQGRGLADRRHDL